MQKFPKGLSGFGDFIALWTYLYLRGAITDIKTVFTTKYAKTLADLKGIAFTFPITVKNDTDLTVNFTLKF
jgi:hypothetical protein